MRAYLRQDGNYDVFPDSVEPTVVAAAEIEAILKQEELRNRREVLLNELAEIDAQLNVENNERPTEEFENQHTTETIRKRW